VVKLAASLVAATALFLGGLFSGCGTVAGDDGDPQTTVLTLLSKPNLTTGPLTITLPTEGGHTFPSPETTAEP
jgi:hypothetical protein